MATIQCGDQVFQNIEAILFDKDGTLADASEFLKSLGQKRSRLVDAQIPGVQEPLLMAFGLEADQLNPAGLLAVGSRYENEIAAAAYIAETGRDWLTALNIARSAFTEADSYLKRKADATPLFPGVAELLQHLAAVPLKLGILSTDTPENVQDFVLKYDLASYLQVQLGSLPGLSKPDPIFFQRACELLGVTPQTTLMVGDAPLDLQMARAAGAGGCVGVTWGGTEAMILRAADVAIASPEAMQGVP